MQHTTCKKEEADAKAQTKDSKIVNAQNIQLCSLCLKSETNQEQ